MFLEHPKFQPEQRQKCGITFREGEHMHVKIEVRVQKYGRCRLHDHPLDADPRRRVHEHGRTGHMSLASPRPSPGKMPRSGRDQTT